MNGDCWARLEALGFTHLELAAIELVLVRMGNIETCEHTRPRFIECYTLDKDDSINDAHWYKGMRETGFKDAAILLAEHGLGVCRPGCPLCTERKS